MKRYLALVAVALLAAFAGTMLAPERRPRRGRYWHEWPRFDGPERRGMGSA